MRPYRVTVVLSGLFIPIHAYPQEVLEISGVGKGYSTPAITADRIVVTGEREKTGYLQVFDLEGKQVWERSYGEEFTISYPGSRAAPIVIDSLIYKASGTAEIHCFNIRNGSELWAVNMVKDLGGINPIFGYSMQLVIDGDRLICSPSGPVNNVVALNRFTGALIWSSPAKGEPVRATVALQLNWLRMAARSGLSGKTWSLIPPSGISSGSEPGCTDAVIPAGNIWRLIRKTGRPAAAMTLA